MKKIIALLLAVLMLATALAACGGNTPGGGNNGSAGDSGDIESGANLKVWVPKAMTELTQQMCDAFVEEHADKNLSVTVEPQEEGNVASSILTDPQVAADVFSFVSDQVNRLDNSKVLSVVPDANVEEIKGRDSEESVNAATLNGTVLAYPETGENGYYLAYDKSVVTDEDAKTLEGVLEACRKCGRKFNMNAGDGFYACMFPFTGGLATDGLDEEGNQKFNNYNEEEVLDALEAFSNLFNEYKDIFQNDNVDKTGSGMAQDPKTVAAGIDGSWNAAIVKKNLGENYGAVKLPTINIKGEDKQIISISGYKLIGVNDLTQNPNAAHALANYLAGEECQLKRAEEKSWSPSNMNVQQSDAVKNNEGSAACLEQAKYAVPQININEIFWAPFGNLGKFLCTAGNNDRDKLKTEFDKAVSTVEEG